MEELLVASAHAIAIPHDREPVGAMVEGLTWTAAFELAESIVCYARQPAILSFDNGAMTLRNQFEDSARRILLPNADKLDLMSGLAVSFGFKSRKRPSAEAFVLPFLTFMESGRRIGLVGDDLDMVGGLRANLSRHAPWHQFIPIDPSKQTDGKFDLAIICASRSKNRQSAEHLSASVSPRLTIVTDNSLLRWGDIH